MRIVGYKEHPEMKITLMHLNNRYAVKFEIHGMEQTYKIREGRGIENVNQVKALIKEDVLSRIKQNFKEMGQIKNIMLSNAGEEDEYDEEIL